MKRKLVAVFLSAALIMGSTALPVSASALASGDTAVEAFRFDNAAYNYRKTTDLEAEVVNNKVVVTWPVVDKNGNVIDANPLQSTSSVGDPKQGYTYTTAGMVLVLQTGILKAVQQIRQKMLRVQSLYIWV